MSPSEQEATPAVEVIDLCGIDADTVAGVPVEGVASYGTVPFEGGVNVTAIPADGFTLVPAEGWAYDPHAGTVSTIISFTDVPCEGTEVTEGEDTAIPPITELPATGVDAGLAFGVAIAVVLIVVGVMAALAPIGGAKREAASWKD